MDDKTKKMLTSIGVDLDRTLNRFMGNEALYFKFLRKYGEDKSYIMIQENLDKGNYDEAFRAAHTLKGISANLGLDAVVAANDPVVEKLRASNDTRPEGIEQDMEKLSDIYVKTLNVLEEITL